MRKITKFSKEIHEKMGYYVYLLVDPRDNNIFYVGKGEGNRIFTHIEDAVAGHDEVNEEKNYLIREIIKSGNEVALFIVRWGLTEDEAFKIESVLIDLFTNELFKDKFKMTNKVSGHGSKAFGIQTPEQLIAKLSTGNLDIENLPHKVIAITLNRSLNGDALYEAIRGNWNMSIAKAQMADYVLAVYDGVIIGVFEPEKDSWRDVAPDKGKENLKRNWIRFDGKEVEDPDILKAYLYKRLPEKQKGAANPVNYLF